MLFINNYSQFTWFYPIQYKYDVYSCFIKFKTLVENQLSCKIKQFQSDGGEFTSHHFKSYLKNNGILYRISCSYTPQQNRMSERKHRHIIEIGLSLLVKSHLPTTF